MERTVVRAVIGALVMSAFGVGCGKEAGFSAPQADEGASRADPAKEEAKGRAFAGESAPAATAAASAAPNDGQAAGLAAPNDPYGNGPVGNPYPNAPSPGEHGKMGGKPRAAFPARGAPPPEMPVQPNGAMAQRPLVAIDPNGRFATTYRPGAGHLAAFESAVARGIVPTSEREIVSDVGARYAPAFAVPAKQALALRADLEREKLQPSGGPFHLRVTLRSTADKPAVRPHLSVHLVLDISGSMKGDSITHAREAARALVDKLAADDDFSFVTFSNEATLRVPDGPVGARRAAIRKSIEGVEATGGTNIGAGLGKGYAEAQTKTIPADAVKVVLLLSDGRANIGVTQQAQLSKLALDAFQEGIQTSAFGLGPDYDGALMSSIAEEGAGGYYYLRDASQIAPALSTEIDKRLDPVASAVEVRVRLKKGVELLHVYGSDRLNDVQSSHVRMQEVAADRQAEKRDKIATDRQDDLTGGMRFFMPAFAGNDAHSLLFSLRVPAGAGKLPLGIVELRYKDRVGKKNQSDELPIVATYADSDAASGATLDRSVQRTVQGFAAGETLMDAARRISAGDPAGALKELGEREQLLRKASETLGEPLFLLDANRLARLEAHAGRDTGLGEPLVLAMMMETAGHAHLR